MRTRHILYIALVAIMCCMVAVTPAAAATGGDGMIHKLGRGLSNGLTGWMELPYNMHVGFRGDNPAESVLTGMLKGTILGVGRMAVGVVETGTFFLPMPANYEPIMHDPQYFSI